MAICTHKFVIYIGEQETLIEDKFIKLYQCVNCSSTITLRKNPYSTIINPHKNIKNTPLEK